MNSTEQTQAKLMTDVLVSICSLVYGAEKPEELGLKLDTVTLQPRTNREGAIVVVGSATVKGKVSVCKEEY